MSVFQSNKNVFFLMEYYPGGDLYDLMTKGGPLQEEKARFYAAEVIMSLDYLHEMGVIYRDLKVV